MAINKYREFVKDVKKCKYDHEIETLIQALLDGQYNEPESEEESESESDNSSESEDSDFDSDN
jgi:hypothetical protein